jgi:hypothetical protein
VLFDIGNTREFLARRRAGGRLLADFRPIIFAPDPASFGCEA